MPTKKKKKTTKTTKPRKSTKAKATKKKRAGSGDASGGHDRASAKKFKRGGRVEAYTFGEALDNKDWP